MEEYPLSTIHLFDFSELQSSSLECSIRVMIQSGTTPLVNSLWNLS